MTLSHSDGWIGNWSPGIGDPTTVGWLTVIFYFFGAWQCYRLVTIHSSALKHREKTLWCALMLGLLALGINKQLDLQTALTEMGRIVASKQGWFDRRHEVQEWFVYSVAAVAGLIGMAGALLSRQAPSATIVAFVGSILLLAFVVIRAASFHHFDAFISSELLGLSMNGIMEIGGILIIVVSAHWRSRN